MAAVGGVSRLVNSSIAAVTIKAPIIPGIERSNRFLTTGSYAMSQHSEPTPDQYGDQEEGHSCQQAAGPVPKHP